MSFLSSKTPAEKREAELYELGRKIGKFAVRLEGWMEDIIDRAEAKWLQLKGDDDDEVRESVDWLSKPPLPLPLLRRDFALKSVKPADIDLPRLAKMDGLDFLRDVASELDAKLLIEVREEKPAPSFWNRGQLRESYARVFVTIDPNRPHDESTVVLPPQKVNPPAIS